MNDSQDNDAKLVDSLTLEQNLNVKPSSTSSSLNTTTIRLFRDLVDNEKPIVPYDESDLAEYYYEQSHERRCSICTSPFRNLLEKVYLNNNKRPNAVVNFFEVHYNARLNWLQVSTHVNNHCNFSKISVSGLSNYEGRESEIAKWKYREYDLVLTALLVELDDVRGLDARTSDLKLRRAMMVDKLTTRLMQLRKERDEAGAGFLNIFEILFSVCEKMVSDVDKQIIKEYVSTLRQQLKES